MKEEWWMEIRVWRRKNRDEKRKKEKKRRNCIGFFLAKRNRIVEKKIIRRMKK